MRYDRDGRLGRTMAGSDQQLQKDQVSFLRFFLKLAVFPVWILVIWFNRRHRKQEMIKFADVMLQPGGTTARAIATKWAEVHHRHYPLAEYSTNFPKLEKEFADIIASSPRRTRLAHGQ